MLCLPYAGFLVKLTAEKSFAVTWCNLLGEEMSSIDKHGTASYTQNTSCWLLVMGCTYSAPNCFVAPLLSALATLHPYPADSTVANCRFTAKAHCSAWQQNRRQGSHSLQAPGIPGASVFIATTRQENMHRSYSTTRFKNNCKMCLRTLFFFIPLSKKELTLQTFGHFFGGDLFFKRGPQNVFVMTLFITIVAKAGTLTSYELRKCLPPRSVLQVFITIKKRK